LVDTQGFRLKVVVSGAEAQDRDGGRLVAHDVRLFGPSLPRRALIWADAADAGAFVEELHQQCGWTVEIVKRREEQPEHGASGCNPIAGLWNARSTGSRVSVACPGTTNMSWSQARP
jgi:hypothetical protein